MNFISRILRLAIVLTAASLTTCGNPAYAGDVRKLGFECEGYSVRLVAEGSKPVYGTILRQVGLWVEIPQSEPFTLFNIVTTQLATFTTDGGLTLSIYQSGTAFENHQPQKTLKCEKL